MKKIFLIFVVALSFASCQLDLDTKYYTMSKIENVTLSPQLASITAVDDLHISATITHHYGAGSACVKYWVCDNTWGEDMPELKIKNNILYGWADPANEEEKGEWKHLTTLKHTDIVSIKADTSYAFEAVIPKQQAGKFVIFKIYFTNLYGFVASSEILHYTVKP